MKVSKVALAAFLVMLAFTLAAIQFGTLHDERGVSQLDMIASVVVLIVIPALILIFIVWRLEE